MQVLDSWLLQPFPAGEQVGEMSYCSRAPLLLLTKNGSMNQTPMYTGYLEQPWVEAGRER
jgi:hypothetical protein